MSSGHFGKKGFKSVTIKNDHKYIKVKEKNWFLMMMTI